MQEQQACAESAARLQKAHEEERCTSVKVIRAERERAALEKAASLTEAKAQYELLAASLRKEHALELVRSC